MYPGGLRCAVKQSGCLSALDQHYFKLQALTVSIIVISYNLAVSFPTRLLVMLDTGH